MEQAIYTEQRGKPPEHIEHAVRGDTYRYRYQARDINGNPRDLSDLEFTFEVRYSKYDDTGDPLIRCTEFLLSTSNDAVNYDDKQGHPPGTTKDVVTAQIPEEDMDVIAGEWEFDYRETDLSGDRKTRDSGILIIAEDTSRNQP